MTAARFITGAAAVWVFVAGLCWGTRAAGGADSYGYISQASLVLRGSLIIDQPIARSVPWPDADWTLAPLGYRPGVARGTIVPVYPVGLPLVMAPLQWLGGPWAVLLAVPLLGAVAVIAASGLASRLSGPAAGAFAALLLAARPTFLHSAMWPMSDVPAAGWWALALFLATGTGVASATGSGLSAALAILTRPNLVGLALAPALYLAGRIGWAGSNRRRAVLRLATFVVLTTAGCLAVAAINTSLYGSPLRSGYGDVRKLYSGSYASANLLSYVTSPLKFEPVLFVLGLTGAIGLLGRRDDVRPIAWLCLATIGLVFGSYALYPPSPDWWYMRFLLSAYPAAAALGGVGALRLARLAAEWEPELRQALSGLIVVAGLLEARERGAFGLRPAVSRHETLGRFVTRALPANAAFFTFEESGSLRHYAGRMTVRFDLLAPEWFDTAIATMRARGYRPYFLVEQPEMALFRDRFGPASVLGRLDWPPLAELEGPIRVQIFDPADRDKWRAGQPLVPRRIE